VNYLEKSARDYRGVKLGKIIFETHMSDVEITVYEKETGDYFHSARFSK